MNTGLCWLVLEMENTECQQEEERRCTIHQTSVASPPSPPTPTLVRLAQHCRIGGCSVAFANNVGSQPFGDRSGLLCLGLEYCTIMLWAAGLSGAR